MCVRSIDVTYHYLISVLIFKCHVPVEKSLLHGKIEIPRKNPDKRNKLYMKVPLRGPDLRSNLFLRQAFEILLQVMVYVIFLFDQLSPKWSGKK